MDLKGIVGSCKGISDVLNLWWKGSLSLFSYFPTEKDRSLRSFRLKNHVHYVII